MKRASASGEVKEGSKQEEADAGKRERRRRGQERVVRYTDESRRGEGKGERRGARELNFVEMAKDGAGSGIRAVQWGRHERETTKLVPILDSVDHCDVAREVHERENQHKKELKGFMLYSFFTFHFILFLQDQNLAVDVGLGEPKHTRGKGVSHMTRFSRTFKPACKTRAICSASP